MLECFAVTVSSYVVEIEFFQVNVSGIPGIKQAILDNNEHFSS